MPDQRNLHVRPDVAQGASRKAHRLALAAAFTLAIGTVACGSDTKPSSAPSITQTSAPAATVAAITTTTTAAPTTTAAATTTTKAATTTAPARTAVAKGTYARIPESLLPAPAAADGWISLTGEDAWTGDMAGKEAFTVAFSPADADGVIIERADSTFTGALAGVGDGSFSWHEADHSTADDLLPGSAPAVGVSGVFEGATGTMSWTPIDDNRGTYEVDLVWA
jgi:hypothetical protein